MMMAAARFWRKIRAFGQKGKRMILALLLMLLWLTLLGPAWAEKPPEKVVVKVPVMLDGRELFWVSDSGEFTAAERGKNINALLEEKLDGTLKSGMALEVKIALQNEQITLRINDRHLVTVTARDTIPGVMLAEQAQIWQENLQEAIARAKYERTPAYMDLAIKLTLGSIIVAIAVQCILIWIDRRYRRRQLRREGSERGSWQLLVLLLLRIGIGIAVAGYIANLFPWTRRWLYKAYQVLITTFSVEIFTLGKEVVSLNRLLLMAVLTLGLWIGVSWLTKLLKSHILPLGGGDQTVRESIAYFLRYGLIFFGSLLILTVGGFDFRSLAIIISVLGVGIGFGLQNIVKDFISGLIMSFDRPIKVGELVQVGEFQGLVQRIGPRVTEISTIERVIVMIPNSRFIEGEVQNWNRSGLTRVKVYVGVPYGADMELVHKVLLAAAQAAQAHHPDILRHPPPKVKFRGFGDSALNFRVVVFIRNPLSEPKVRTLVYNQVEAYLRQYQIEIPFPQRSLQVNIPQFKELAATWQKQPAKGDLDYPDRVRDNDIPAPPVVQPEYDWQAIVSQMRGPSGVEIKDRRSNLKSFGKCFVGSEAVDWLMEHEKATREEAILIGELMVSERLIHHVLDEHGFNDGPLFYRFYADENTTSKPD
ncbi:MAG: mechanosensitive ion channel [Hormoscilla sp. GUM202]|nr:mechanosensitive ion channel [Hormoscilla sp. GUM202]